MNIEGKIIGQSYKAINIETANGKKVWLAKFGIKNKTNINFNSTSFQSFELTDYQEKNLHFYDTNAELIAKLQELKKSPVKSSVGVDYFKAFDKAYEDALKVSAKTQSISIGTCYITEIKGNTSIGKNLKKWCEETKKGQLRFSKYGGSFWLYGISHGYYDRNVYGEFINSLNRQGIKNTMSLWEHQD